MSMELFYGTLGSTIYRHGSQEGLKGGYCFSRKSRMNRGIVDLQSVPISTSSLLLTDPLIHPCSISLLISSKPRWLII